MTTSNGVPGFEIFQAKVGSPGGLPGSVSSGHSRQLGTDITGFSDGNII
jgi:hypothetical protein